MLRAHSHDALSMKRYPKTRTGKHRQVVRTIPNRYRLCQGDPFFVSYLTQKLLGKLGMRLDQLDHIELNEAFAAQALACLRELGVDDNDPRVNPNGGAIALGHPLGMSGARIVTSAMHELQLTGGRFALCTMCIGVGQGIATVIERV